MNQVHVTRLTPDAIRSWSPADQTRESQLAHAPQWATVITRAYGHDPLYLAADDTSGHQALLPAFVVRRPLVGPVVTSMPFLDGGGPTTGLADLVAPLIHRLIDEARRIGARFVDLRCSERLPLEAVPMEHKVNMVLPLCADPDRLWTRLDKGARNQIRKAGRSGLSVEYGGAEYLDAFYGVFVTRMRELGSPVHAKGFFRAIFDGFGDRARVFIVKKGTTTVGGLIALASGDSVTVPWASCLTEYFPLCPNMLLYWEAIAAGCRDGASRFDFGRSTRDSGTYRFKRQWGAQEQPLFWYTLPVDASESVATRRSSSGLPAAIGAGASTLVNMWRRLPIGVTRHLGPRVRRYLIR